MTMTTTNNNNDSNISSSSSSSYDHNTFFRCMEILEYYVVKAQQPDQVDACKIIDDHVATTTSGDDDLEVAAETSHAYWYVRKHHDYHHHSNSGNNNKDKLAAFRRAAAVREAARHLEGETFEDAIQLLKKTIEFHRTNCTTLYRECAAVTATDNSSDNNPNSKLREARRKRIHGELTNVQTYCVRGHDRDDRAVIFAYPRKVSGGDDQSFVDTIIYTMERAIACSEYISCGHQEKIVTVLNSRGSTSPSMTACKEGVRVLQHHYPGRLKNLIILNPPFVLMTIYNMIKPFLDPDTKSKFIIVKTDKQKIATISNLIDVSQAMPIMLPGGKLTSDVHPQTYFYNVPFHRLYDDNDDVGGRDNNNDNNDDDGNGHTQTTTEGSITTTTTSSSTEPGTAPTTPLVKKPSFIKTLAVGEFHNEEDVEPTVLVDPVRS